MLEEAATVFQPRSEYRTFKLSSGDLSKMPDYFLGMKGGRTRH